MSLNFIIILLSIFNIYKPFLPSFFKFDNFQIFRILTLVIPFVHTDTIFSRPTSFLQKSSCTCRVSSEKNILNSSVEWSRVEKLDISYIFVYFLTHFLFIINTVIRGVHDIDTCVIRKSQSLTYCFLFINIKTVTRGAHDMRTCVLWEFLTLTYCFVSCVLES